MNILQPAVGIFPPDPTWAAIPADDGPTPQFIWKDYTNGYPDGEALPFVFTRAFSRCSSIPYQGSLWANADDSYIALVNGVPAAACGTPALSIPALGLQCFQEYQGVAFEVLPVNELVILVWNGLVEAPPLWTIGPNPAMVQYRVDF